jgi:hypothetical protein
MARIAEFVMQRRGFYARGPDSYRWSMARPFHVAFEDSYVRANSKLNIVSLTVDLVSPPPEHFVP